MLKNNNGSKSIKHTVLKLYKAIDPINAYKVYLEGFSLGGKIEGQTR